MDRRGFAFVQDLFCVLVAMVAVSLLIVNLASTFAANEEQSVLRRLSEDARRICDDLLRFEPMLWKGEIGVFDEEGLDVLDAGAIEVGLRIDSGFSLQIHQVLDDNAVSGRSWSWSSGPPAEDLGVCVTSASMHGGGSFSPARVVLQVWRD